MARKPLITKDSLERGIVTVAQEGNEDTKRLTELVNSYAVLNLELKEKKKIADEQNAEIKELMRKLNITEFEGDDFTANYSERKKEYFDETPMIEWMKRRKVAHWTIKTKEYIDTNELEDAIYQGKIDDIDLDFIKNNFKKVDKTPTLTISKRKEKK